MITAEDLGRHYHQNHTDVVASARQVKYYCDILLAETRKKELRSDFGYFGNEPLRESLLELDFERVKKLVRLKQTSW